MQIIIRVRFLSNKFTILLWFWSEEERESRKGVDGPTDVSKLISGSYGRAQKGRKRYCKAARRSAYNLLMATASGRATVSTFLHLKTEATEALKTEIQVEDRGNDASQA